MHPGGRSTRRWTSTIRASHVVGPAALVGLDEVGVLGRHLGGAARAGPWPRPARSAGRPSRPGGLVNTEPAFGPPGWCSRRQRTISAIVGLGPVAVTRARGRARPRPRPVTRRPPSGGSDRSRSVGRHPSILAGAPGRRTRTLTSVAAMSEPCPPAFIRTAPPTDPGTPTAHSKPVRPAAAVRRATTGRLAAPPARTVVPSMSMLAKCSPSTTARPSNPASATSRFEPRPTTSTAHARWPSTAAATVAERRLVVHLDQQRGRAADPVGREPASETSRPGQVAEQLARPELDAPSRQLVRRCPITTLPITRLPITTLGRRWCNRSCTSSGSEVRSPAPRVRHRSPGRSSWPR